jgi:hypothetical protein
MRIATRKVLAFTLILSLAVLAAGAWAGPPTEAVRGTVDEVIRLLSDPSSQVPGPKTAAPPADQANRGPAL